MSRRSKRSNNRRRRSNNSKRRRRSTQVVDDDHFSAVINIKEIPDARSNVNMKHLNNPAFAGVYIDFSTVYGPAIFTQMPSLLVMRKIGAGAFGQIYEVCFHNKLAQKFALKIERMSFIFPSVDEFRKKKIQEIKIQKELSSVSFSVEPYELGFFEFRTNFYSYTVMHFLTPGQDFIVGSLLKTQDLPMGFFDDLTVKIIEIVDFLCAHSIIHGDLHWDNIYMHIPDGQLQNVTLTSESYIGLLDFGYSLRGVKCDRELELLSLLRDSFSKKNDGNLQHIIKDYMLHYNISKPDDLADFYAINNRYNKLFREHVANYLVV